MERLHSRRYTEASWLPPSEENPKNSDYLDHLSWWNETTLQNCPFTMIEILGTAGRDMWVVLVWDGYSRYKPRIDFLHISGWIVDTPPAQNFHRALKLIWPIWCDDSEQGCGDAPTHNCCIKGSPFQIHIEGIWALPVKRGGMQSLFGQCPNAFAWIWKGLPKIVELVFCSAGDICQR